MVAAERDHPERRLEVIERLGGQTLLLALGMCVGFALVAPRAVPLLYGHRYAQGALLVGLIGMLQSTRFLINWPTTVNLSLGRSRAVLASNVARFLAYPGAFVGVRLLGGLRGMVAGFAAGEMMSIVIAVMLMNRSADRPWFAGFDRLATFVLACGAVVLWNLALARGSLIMEAALLLGSLALLAWVGRREADVLTQAMEFASRRILPRFARRRAAG
jgi:O-antigen/teichoic acid export membrane protein